MYADAGRIREARRKTHCRIQSMDMGYLQQFFEKVFRERSEDAPASRFEHLSEAELEEHLNRAQYGDFLLTDAIRPSCGLEVVPRQGFRHDMYRDAKNRAEMPVLMISASRERLLDLFLELLDPLGNEVDVVLETSHDRKRDGHVDLYRECIDLPVLKSVLCDYDDLLLDDGCSGVAVLNPALPLEVQFDEHKLLIVYGRDLRDFEYILSHHGVDRDDELRFITEAEHVHSSSDQFASRFDELRMRLGIDAQFAEDHSVS
jgi:hypothetical protein